MQTAQTLLATREVPNLQLELSRTRKDAEQTCAAVKMLSRLSSLGYEFKQARDRDSRETAERQPRDSRETAERQPNYSRGTAECLSVRSAASRRRAWRATPRRGTSNLGYSRLISSASAGAQPARRRRAAAARQLAAGGRPLGSAAKLPYRRHRRRRCSGRRAAAKDAARVRHRLCDALDEPRRPAPQHAAGRREPAVALARVLSGESLVARGVPAAFRLPMLVIRSRAL